jgi:glycerol-3-phosphate dehydrogenase (NAD(P)+)
MRREKAVQEVLEHHQNRTHLPGINLPESLSASSNLASVVDAAELVLMVVPSEFSRSAYRDVHPLAPPGAALVSATKGLETGTLLRMSEVAAQEAPGRRVAVLSGPSFALEVARELPTALVVASADAALAESVQKALSTRALRVYRSDDVVGVELGGALKNVIAIAAGISDGLGLGDNAKAALITRGLSEMARLGEACGARGETFSGLAGMGDLIVTCFSRYSRNRRAGELIAQGLSPDEAREEIGMVVEGLTTAPVLRDLSRRLGVELPITEAICEVLNGMSALDLVSGLMSRTPTEE